MESQRSFHRVAGSFAALPEAFTAPRHLLTALLTSPPFGVGIWDRRMRYQAVNDSLAAMNGLPAAAHLGQSIDNVLGGLSATIASHLDRVLVRNEVLPNIYVTGRLPARTDVGHWITTWFPVRNGTSKISQVGCVALEITQIMKLQQTLRKLTRTLLTADAAMWPRTPRKAAVTSPDAAHAFSQPVDVLVQQSIRQARAISDSVTSAFRRNIGSPLLDPLLQPLPSAFTTPLTSWPSQTDDNTRLSFREREVLSLLAHSKTNKEIAAALALSVRTVETYRARLMLKLGLHSVAQLVRYAIRNNLI